MSAKEDFVREDEEGKQLQITYYVVNEEEEVDTEEISI
jgi:hypothetical protein